MPGPVGRQLGLGRLLALQRLAGNAAVARLVATPADALTTPVQRQSTGPTRLPELSPARVGNRPRLVPAISEQSERAAAALLRDEAQRQRLLDLMTQALVAAGLVGDPSLMVGGGPIFDWSEPDDGLTRPPDTGYQPGGRNVCQVKVGPSAFRALPALAATIVHEYWHVLQHQHDGRTIVREQQFGSRHDAASDEAEVEAWAHDLILSPSTGTDQYPTEMARGWRSFVTHWKRLTFEQRTPLLPLYQGARAAAYRVVRGWMAAYGPRRAREVDPELMDSLQDPGL